MHHHEKFESFPVSSSDDHKAIPFAETVIVIEAKDATDKNVACLAGQLIGDEIKTDTMRPQDVNFDAFLKHLSEEGVDTHHESFNLFFEYRGKRISVKNNNSLKMAITTMKNERRPSFIFYFNYMAPRKILNSRAPRETFYLSLQLAPSVPTFKLHLTSSPSKVLLSTDADDFGKDDDNDDDDNDINQTTTKE